MKRKISCILVLALLFGLTLALPSSAYTRLSYGTDCLAAQSELIKSGLRGSDIRFTEADFKQALGVSRVSSVTLLSLPPVTDGVLKAGGVPCVTGQVLDRASIATLTFTPASAAVENASFTFCANSTAGTTSLTCNLRILDRINYAPTVLTVTETALQAETHSGVNYFGSMAAEDPEDDALTYLVISYPKKGSLTLTDAASGSFRYAPNVNARGSDSFTYVVRDAYGNYSTPATVQISIKDRANTEIYTDMKNHPAHNAALTVTAASIMMGEIEGGGICFRPDGTVSRADFLVMVMKAAKVAPIANLAESSFDDNCDIAASVRPYVATAQRYGYVNGSFDGTGLYFEPNREITRAEAAVIMNNILNTDTPASLPVFADADSIPTWAKADIYALTEAGIFYPNAAGSVAANAQLTRADAAVMLAAIMNYSA